MKLLQRIVAILGIIILIGIYASTIIFAMMKSPASKDMLMASIYCTVAVPILMFAILSVARVLSKDDSDR